MSRLTTSANSDMPIMRAPRAGDLAAALVAPWHATRRQTFWISVLLFGLGCTGALGFGFTIANQRGQLAAMTCYVFGVAFVWAFSLSGLLLVARDAWRTAVPSVVRNTTLAAVLYALLTIAPPTVIEAVFGWNAAMAALMAALALVGGLAFALLPRWAAMCLGFAPAIYAWLYGSLHLASPLAPSFLDWGSVLFVVLLAPIVWRWHRLVRSGSDDSTGWNSPLIFQMRKQAVSGAWAFDKQLFWRGNTRQHRFANLHGIDARTPVRAIEVALGAMFVPQTTMGNLRRLGAVAWPLVLFTAAMLLSNLNYSRSLSQTLVTAGIGGAMWAGIFGTTMALFAVYALLRRRWRQGAEPALLALLPGLDAHAPLHRSVLRAAFTKPILVCVALWLLMIACEALMHSGALAIALTTAVVACMCLLTGTFLLRAFSGRPVHVVAQAAVGALGLVLMFVSLVFAVIASLGVTGAIATLVAWGVVAVWVVFGGLMAILALRAWRAFKAQPHPFLAGPR